MVAPFKTFFPPFSDDSVKLSVELDYCLLKLLKILFWMCSHNKENFIRYSLIIIKHQNNLQSS